MRHVALHASAEPAEAGTSAVVGVVEWCLHFAHVGPMRDLFEEMTFIEPLDPTEAARRGMRQRLRHRFYQHAEVVEGVEGNFDVTLDARPVRTPARRALAVPSRGLAEAIAVEWDAQGELIDPASMPLTRLANTVIDGVAEQPAAVAAEVEKYLGSDLVLYRADAPDGLIARQTAAWDPILAFARETLRARFTSTRGMIFAAQPQEAIAAAASAIPRGPGRAAWRLGALHSMTTLTGSALIALAFAGGALSLEEAWSAAHVDEDWNMDLWGRDPLALDRRTYRFAEMQAAARVLQMV